MWSSWWLRGAGEPRPHSEAISAYVVHHRLRTIGTWTDRPGRDGQPSSTHSAIISAVQSGETPNDAQHAQRSRHLGHPTCPVPPTAELSFKYVYLYESSKPNGSFQTDFPGGSIDSKYGHGQHTDDRPGAERSAWNQLSTGGRDVCFSTPVFIQICNQTCQGQNETPLPISHRFLRWSLSTNRMMPSV